jgi:ABC-type molybdate transport system substrate-binding protein
MSDTASSAAALTFVAYLSSDEAQTVFEDFGFIRPLAH